VLDRYRTGLLASINVSGGGVPKRRVTGADVSRLGLLGDAQNDTIDHGGPERAVCVYSLERIQALQTEGHPIDVGTAGENVTLEGIDWNLVVPGARLRLGKRSSTRGGAGSTPGCFPRARSGAAIPWK
jgi:MOSC domain-containing protein YiiM